MSSRRKEKKIKGTDTVPCLPPQKYPIFVTPLRNFPKIKGAVTVNPLGNDFLGGNWSGHLNGIDHHLFMVRGITL